MKTDWQAYLLSLVPAACCGVIAFVLAVIVFGMLGLL